MSPNYFETDPKPATPAKAKRIAPISSRQIAKRKASGETFLSSTIPKKAGGEHSKRPIPKKAKKRERNDPARIYGPAEFTTHLHRSRCLYCGGSVAIEQAHMGNGGMGRKSDYRDTGPLCGPHQVTTPGIGSRLVQGCHRDYDRHVLTPDQRQLVQTRQREFIAEYFEERSSAGGGEGRA